MVVDTVRQGVGVRPPHYGHGSESANQHTCYARDPVSYQPHLNRRRLRFGGLASGNLSRGCWRGLRN